MTQFKAENLKRLRPSLNYSLISMADILSISTRAFAQESECCTSYQPTEVRNLVIISWQGLSQAKEVYKISDLYLENSKKPGNPVYELYKYIDSLTKEEKEELVALMWLGREGESYSYHLSNAQEEDQKTSYITEKRLLAKYLRDGLNELSTDKQ